MLIKKESEEKSRLILFYISFFFCYSFRSAFLFINGRTCALGYYFKGFNHLLCQRSGFACAYESSVKFGQREQTSAAVPVTKISSAV